MWTTVPGQCHNGKNEMGSSRGDVYRKSQKVTESRDMNDAAADTQKARHVADSGAYSHPQEIIKGVLILSAVHVHDATRHAIMGRMRQLAVCFCRSRTTD